MRSIRFFPLTVSVFVVVWGLLGASSDALAQALPILKDCSVASLSGSSQALLDGTSANRKYLLIQNTGNANIGVNPQGGTALIGGTGTITIPPGAAKEWSLYGGGLPFPPFNVITAIGTSGQSLTCLEGK